MIPSRLSSPGGLEKSPVSDYTIGEKKLDTACRSDFTHDDVEYSVIYDSISGIPYEMSAKSGNVSVSAVIEEFIPEKD